MPLQVLRPGIALAMALPMAGIGGHQLFHAAAQRGDAGQFSGNGVKAVKRLAQGKGQPGADLEDGEAVAHKGGKGFGGLVVG